MYASATAGVALGREDRRVTGGLLVLAAAASAGLLGPDLVALADSGSTALFTLAFVGLGLDIRLDSMRRVGVAPLVALFGHLLVVSALTLVAVLFLL